METPASLGFGPNNGLLSRHHFPKGFTFGTASSAFQYEGAVNEDGRGPSIWDTFVLDKGMVGEGSNGIEAVDHYNRYEEDVRIIKEMGLDSYRFSISWTRVLPSGKKSGGVNEEGIRFYNNLIDKLLAHGIQPYVTLLHFDPPQGLEDEYGGFLCPQIVEDFRDYADLCFKEFGDRVKHWITINEPWSFSVTGYALGIHAPGRSSIPQQRLFIDIKELLPSNPYCCEEAVRHRRTPTSGDSGLEPYVVSHHQILAHAAAVDLYRQKYQTSQKGNIGITLVSIWTIPFTETTSDRDAAERALDFMFGWFMDPLTTGDYPKSMRRLVGSRLPKFTEQESKTVKGSFDFLGLNYYTSNYAANAPNTGSESASYVTDSQVLYQTVRNGVPIGEKGGSDWLYMYPRGIKDLLLYIKKKYNDPIIYITENGIDEKNDATLSLWESLYDHHRISCHSNHLSFLKGAIEDGVKVRGYFAWSLLDNFEWASAFTVRFGINYIDYEDGLKRYPKLSAGWFKYFLKNETTVEPLSE